jgi:hypothetical protein
VKEAVLPSASVSLSRLSRPSKVLLVIAPSALVMRVALPLASYSKSVALPRRSVTSSRRALRSRA